MTVGNQERNRADVARFYELLRTRDTAQITSYVEQHFAEDVILTLPDSLSYGGSYQGKEAVKKLFSGLTHPRSPINPADLVVESILADGNQVAVHLKLPWGFSADAKIPIQIVEWLTIKDALVSDMRVFYFDTAACLQAAHTPR